MNPSKFPGLGRYAALGSIMAAREQATAARNQTGQGPGYIAPSLPGEPGPVQGPMDAQNLPAPQRSLGGAPMEMSAGQTPELPIAPDAITLPAMPVSSMIRDTAPKNSMAGFIHDSNRKFRSAF